MPSNRLARFLTIGATAAVAAGLALVGNVTAADADVIPMPSPGKVKPVPRTHSTSPTDRLFLTEADVDSPGQPIRRTVHDESDKINQGAMADDSYNPCFNGYGMKVWIGHDSTPKPDPRLRFAVFTGTEVAATQTVLHGATDAEAREVYDTATRLNSNCSAEFADFRSSSAQTVSGDRWQGTWFKVYEGDKRTASMRVAVIRSGANVSTLHFAGDGKDATTAALITQAATRLAE
ncbi:hypothetical protein ACQCX2_07830 [Propionibacteriaceae bacterium Y1700]|uniref:hypothetical protein n=1 Tax=Microlunatus sp. Y1700 TaxID=3418487 RepID=UPI003DA6D32F